MFKKLLSFFIAATPDDTHHQTMIVTPKEVAGDGELIKGSSLRRRWSPHSRNDGQPKVGMWVRYDDKTGILTGVKPGDIVRVMLVDEAGMNVMEVEAKGEDVRQAYHQEIPVPRRPDIELASRLGYVK